MPRLLKTVLFCAVTLATAPVAQADETHARFGVYLFGIKLGEYRLAGEQNARSYATASRFATTGIVAAVADVRFAFNAQGRVLGGRLRPGQYREDMNTGRDARETTLAFPAAGGQVDPATALFLAMRDRPLTESCAMDLRIFDGKRVMHLSAHETGRGDSTLTCAGHLQRISGYSAEEMAESTGFSVSVTLASSGGLWRVQTMKAGTIHGTVSVRRR